MSLKTMQKLYPLCSPLNPYRTHTCGDLRLKNVGTRVRLSGWVHRKRDHGNLLFIDLRDHYGLTQCVVMPESPVFQAATQLKLESVVCFEGAVFSRAPETVNSKMATGEVELFLDVLEVLCEAAPLPLQVNHQGEFPEETRLKYRFLDLRRERLHQNIVLRSHVIQSLRRRMLDQGFLEFQTPILTSSSPEGARDFLVPSRLHPGCFYALPQAPQQFKQLLMVAGFDRYFQIAPCFRDEDSRADRSPGEFYQLDMEMAFVTQEEVFAALEPVLQGVFEEFSQNYKVSPAPFQRIPYSEAMLRYGSDKPDLRNPLFIQDVTAFFKESSFSLFLSAIEKGAVVRALRLPEGAAQSRRFFEKMGEWAKDQGAGGLGYIVFEAEGAKGPIAKFLTPIQLAELQNQLGAEAGDVVFFVAEPLKTAEKIAGALRKKLGEDLDLLHKDVFHFCWIVDFPMYEQEETTGKIIFSHNPFSMPQGGMTALETQDPLTVKAYQYDIVCNGIELSSGAIRNHLPEVMFKAFAIAGYSPKEVEDRFGGLLRAFQYGAPPHGGCAPGVDRIVMLLAQEPNLREVVAFPLNQKAEDLLMNAPAPVLKDQLRELHLEMRPLIKS
jgi:aspartyl-tRNA synthetase